MIDKFKSQKRLLFIVIFITFTLFCCTTIPTKEFTSYKEAFNNARAGGEQVLLDYAAALKEDQMDKAERQSVKKFPVSIERPDTFDPVASASEAVEVDPIEVRMMAWDVVARYNDVLSGLAEGRSVKEVTAAADGLVKSLSNFPLVEIADVTGEFIPCIYLLKNIIAKAEQERTKHLFVNAIKEGGTLIEEKFVKFLRDDAIEFYNLRRGLNDRIYSRMKDEVTDFSRKYQSLVSNYKSDDKLEELTNQVNDLRTVVKLEVQVKLKKNGDIKYDSIDFIQLIQLKNQIEEKIAEAKQKTNELFAYQDMIVAYVKMTNKVSDSLKALRLAVEKNVSIVPSMKDLVPAFIELKKTIQIYRANRRS